MVCPGSSNDERVEYTESESSRARANFLLGVIHKRLNMISARIVASRLAAGRLLAGMILTACVTLPGCSHKESVEQASKVMTDYTDTLSEGADVVETVVDEESAKTAAVKLQAATEKLREVRTAVQEMPRIPRSDYDRIQAEYDSRMRRVSARMKILTEQAAELSNREPTLQAALLEFVQAAEEVGKSEASTAP